MNDEQHWPDDERNVAMASRVPLSRAGVMHPPPVALAVP